LKSGAHHERRHGASAEDLARRIRWFASLPWQHEALALQELKRACEAAQSA